jgi:beta-lactamase regulating signal transducer with metallopeptidase domain
MTLADGDTWNNIASLWAPALLRACWQGALAVAVVWLLCRLFPRLSPGTRATLWWLVCLKTLLGLFVAGWVPVAVLPARSTAPPPAVSWRIPSVLPDSEPLPVSAPEVAPLPAAPIVAPAAPLQPISVLLLLWAGGGLVMLGGIWREQRLVQRLIVQARPCTDRALLEKAARACGLTRLPTVLISETACSSLVVGVWQPKVLLCRADWDALDASEQQAVLVHELMHIRRRDLWAGLVPALARVLFFFHPGIWLACREYELAREAACDVESLRVSGLPLADYGKLLLKLSLPPARLTPRPGLTAPGVASPQARLLLRRLHGLKELRDNQTLSRWSSLLVLALTGILLSLAPVRSQERAIPTLPTLVLPAAEAPIEPDGPVVIAEAPAVELPPAIAPTPTPWKLTKGTEPTMKLPVKPTSKLSPVLATAAVALATVGTRLAPVAASPQEVAPVPPSAPLAVVPALAPAPTPAPLTPQVSKRYQYTLRMGDSYSNQTRSESVASGQRKLAEAQPGDCLVVDRDGKRYLITDPATLRKVRDNYAVLESLGKEVQAQGEAMGKEIEARMEEWAKKLEARMEEMGKQMEAKGEEMEALGEKMSTASEADRNALMEKMDVLRKEMEVKGDEMRALGATMTDEGKRLQDEMMGPGKMKDLGKKMKVAAKKAEERMNGILDEAFKKNLATEQRIEKADGIEA